MALEIDRISKRFGAVPAVRAVSLAVALGEFMALLGPSGSGKTTLLRVVGGLELPEEGSLRYDGQDLTHVRARERRVGFVFQSYALFRHMTVAQNIAFGLDVRPFSKRPPRQEIARRVEALLARMQLADLGKRYPSQLSGGQRQRVALARALAIEPRILLLDEPFGALDAKVRKDLRRWLRALHDETRLTTIMVTHDQEEALALADRVAVMNEGRIEQVGTPNELRNHPQSPFVRDFLDTSEAPSNVSVLRGGAGKYAPPRAR
jgi:sulfate transport system ATP-binding protein